jgi:retron-type reverse transcriptase
LTRVDFQHIVIVVHDKSDISQRRRVISHKRITLNGGPYKFGSAREHCESVGIGSCVSELLVNIEFTTFHVSLRFVPGLDHTAQDLCNVPCFTSVRGVLISAKF